LQEVQGVGDLLPAQCGSKVEQSHAARRDSSMRRPTLRRYL
jgi:hypothetical protein